MFYRTFNPGPSQVSDAVKADMLAASEQNIIGISHRSSAFLDITKQAVDGLRQYFEVPKEYHVLFTSSATEAMELIIRNLVEEESFHFANGHFSELFARVSESFGKTATVDAVAWGSQNNHATAVIPPSVDIVTLTYNETSTGVTCNNQTVQNLYQRLADQLLVVDITSAAGCVPVEIKHADVWFFSVQKGMGLPSGLGVILLSPRALERAKRLHHAGLFNFASMTEKMEQHQTLHTPNVLGIYLLAQQLARWNQPGAVDNYQATADKAKLIDLFINAHTELDYFVEAPAARSQSTICVTAAPDVITRLHAAAKDRQLVLGAGYGKLKETTCRISTFPALTLNDMQLLIDALTPAVT